MTFILSGWFWSKIQIICPCSSGCKMCLSLVDPPAVQSLPAMGHWNTWDYSGSPYCRNVLHVLLIVNHMKHVLNISRSPRDYILLRQEEHRPALVFGVVKLSAGLCLITLRMLHLFWHAVIRELFISHQLQTTSTPWSLGWQSKECKSDHVFLQIMWSTVRK